MTNWPDQCVNADSSEQTVSYAGPGHVGTIRSSDAQRMPGAIGESCTTFAVEDSRSRRERNTFLAAVRLITGHIDRALITATGRGTIRPPVARLRQARISGHD